MIKVSFDQKDGLLSGFTLEGHSGFAEQGNDIVCAAVSSAAYMTVNTITDILNLEPEIEFRESDGFLAIKLSSADSLKSQDILCGFRLHLTALAEQYTENILVNISEV